MISSAAPSHSLMRQGTSLITFLKAAWDSLLIIALLYLACAYFDETFDGPELILSLIAFSLTFPSSIPLQAAPRVLAREILTSWAAVALILFSIGYVTRYIDAFAYDSLIAWGVSVPLVLFFTRLTVPYFLPRMLAIEGVRSAVIVGANDLGKRLAHHFDRDTHLGVNFLGFFDDRSADRLQLAPVGLLGSVDDVGAYVTHHPVDAIFIALPMASQPRVLKLLDDLKDSTVSIYFVPDIFLADLIQARLDEIAGMPVVAVCETPFYGINGIVKRASDLVIASIILLLISPLLLLIALGVKLTSAGPALFVQRRYGLDGEEIRVYKFRSMTVCEDGGAITQARKGDARVTRLGAFLRKTSLDELPQFINVLQGRMSIVGPRPHAVAHNEMYRKMIKGYMIRHKVKPGITGLAQVSGARGETDTVEKMEARINYDLEYLRHWSLMLDLKIILRTVWVVFKDQNAY